MYQKYDDLCLVHLGDEISINLHRLDETSTHQGVWFLQS